MRGFLQDLRQEDEDRNTDGRKCPDSKKKEKEGLLATSWTLNSCRRHCYYLDRFTPKTDRTMVHRTRTDGKKKSLNQEP